MKNKNLTEYIGMFMQAGVSIASSILIFLLIGVFLEQKLGTHGIILGVFVLLGVFIGFYQAYRLLDRINIDGEQKKK